MLPHSVSYDLDTAARVPPARAPWVLDPRRAALLVHDMQEHFVAAFTAGASPIAPVRAHVADLVAAARAARMPVLYTAQPAHQQPEERGLLTAMWGSGIGADDAAARIVGDLAPAPADTVLPKWRYDAFERSDLHERLVAAGRDQLLVTGIYAHIGCQATAVRAFMLDIEPFIVADAVADLSAAQHTAALELVADCAGVVVRTCDVLETLRHTATRTLPTDWPALRDQLAAATGADPDELDARTDLASAGLDSVRLMALADSWSLAGREIGFADLALCDTPADLAELLERVHGTRVVDLPA